jgi:hypothetical protein
MLLSILGEVHLGEGNDALVVRLGASRHALAPPTPDHALRGFRAGPVVTVERSSGHVIIKLDSTGAELRQQSVKTPTWADRSDWPSSALGAALRE